LNENINEGLKQDNTKSIKKVSQGFISTFFRNALKSNLDLTSLADSKAGILISINGFILTVSVTASSFATHSTLMTYAFISIILTSLGSIILAILAVKPLTKEKLIHKQHLQNYNSVLYYQDMADLSHEEYLEKTKKIIKNEAKIKKEMINHLHILGTEIKKKYFWLKKAYAYFSLGLIISAILVIYALTNVEQTPFYNLSKGNIAYKEDTFYNIFEPSGATTMPDGRVLIVEDESSSRSLKLIEIENGGDIQEIGNLYIPKKIKKKFRKNLEDLEAITSDGNIVYTTTSFTQTRTGKNKKSRENIAMFTYEDGGIDEFYIYSHLKKDLFKKFPEIFTKNLFNKENINIEGLVYDSIDKTLFLGFRAPLKDSKAILIGIKNPKEIFTKKQKPIFTKPIFLDLNSMGIRGITFDKKDDGFWVIAGGSNNRNTKFSLWFVNRITHKPFYIENQPDIGFAEGITIINNKSLFIVDDNGKKPNKAANYIIIDKDTL